MPYKTTENVTSSKWRAGFQVSFAPSCALTLSSAVVRALFGPRWSDPFTTSPLTSNKLCRGRQTQRTAMQMEPTGEKKMASEHADILRRVRVGKNTYLVFITSDDDTRCRERESKRVTNNARGLLWGKRRGKLRQADFDSTRKRTTAPKRTSSNSFFCLKHSAIPARRKMRSALISTARRNRNKRRVRHGKKRYK